MTIDDYTEEKRIGIRLMDWFKKRNINDYVIHAQEWDYDVTEALHFLEDCSRQDWKECELYGNVDVYFACYQWRMGDRI